MNQQKEVGEALGHPAEKLPLRPSFPLKRNKGAGGHYQVHHGALIAPGGRATVLRARVRSRAVGTPPLLSVITGRGLKLF